MNNSTNFELIERALLGAALKDPDGAAARCLDSRHFDDRLRSIAASCIRKLIDQGSLPDPINLTEALRKHREFLGQNIPILIQDWMEACPSYHQWTVWAKDLSNRYQTQRIKESIDRVQRSTHDNPSLAKATLQSVIDEIDSQSGRSNENICYDASRPGSYWAENKDGTWVQLNETQVKRVLRANGVSPNKLEGAHVSPLDCRLLSIQADQSVHYAGPLAGYHTGILQTGEKRILVTESPKLISPTPGKWSTLESVIKALLLDEVFDQASYFYGWLKIAIEALQAKTVRPGQALVLCGPHGCGKSLLQNLITKLLGGRSAKPYQFMSSQTTFNADLFEAEHLQIEDDQSSTNIQARRIFGANIKSFTVNETQRLHDKNRRAINGLKPFWRVSISVNDEPENLQVLPPLDDSLEDKLIMLKAFKRTMPMPTTTIPQREKFMKTLVEELPAFVNFLLNWKIPVELTSERFGIAHFHHPDLINALTQLSPEEKLLTLIDGELFRAPTRGLWKGSSHELERELTGTNSGCGYEARKLFSWPTACGTYLSRLEKRYPMRIENRRTSNTRNWIIHPPICD